MLREERVRQARSKSPPPRAHCGGCRALGGWGARLVRDDDQRGGAREGDQNDHLGFVMSTIIVISTIIVCVCLGAGVILRVA
eukprot:5626615-Prymnesium_polylepis.1